MGQTRCIVDFRMANVVVFSPLPEVYSQPSQVVTTCLESTSPQARHACGALTTAILLNLAPPANDYHAPTSQGRPRCKNVRIEPPTPRMVKVYRNAKEACQEYAEIQPQNL